MSLNPETVNLYQATVRVLSDRPTQPVDAVFFHARSHGDNTGLIEIVGEMVAAGRAEFVAITNNEGERWGSHLPYEATPGKTEYKRYLIANGVPENKIVTPDLQAFNTREENAAFVEQAAKERWTTGAILTQPHQLLRTMLGAVQAMNQLGYIMELYAITPTTTPWQELVRGNQGIEEKAREEHIKAEYERIVLRQSTGELATFDELFAYWNQRGSLRLTRGLSA